jgi:mannose/fructose/sorbose-specific phosphotransferase system IIA component
MHIIVTGHGTYATGLVDAAELILGTRDGLTPVDFPSTDSAVDLKAHLDAAVGAVPAEDSLVVLCDLKGGSPFNAAAAIARGRPRMTVVYGVSLPFLLDFLGRKGKNGAEVAVLLEKSVDMARKSLGTVAELPRAGSGSSGDGDDDWE